MRFITLRAVLFGFAILVSGTLLTADERNELREKANALKREGTELFRKGHEEEAEKLFRSPQELLEKAERQEAGPRDSEAKHKAADQQHNPDIQRLKERLTDLRAAHQKAKENGSEHEALETREQITQTELKLARLMMSQQDNQGVHRDVPEQFRAQAEKLAMASKRMHHVRAAAENLKAAEMHDMAHELMQRAEAMEQEIHAAKASRAEQMQAGRKDQGQEPRVEVGELRSENERLRHELNELRELVERLHNKQERKPEPDASLFQLE